MPPLYSGCGADEARDDKIARCFPRLAETHREPFPVSRERGHTQSIRLADAEMTHEPRGTRRDAVYKVAGISFPGSGSLNDRAATGHT